MAGVRRTGLGLLDVNEVLGLVVLVGEGREVVQHFFQDPVLEPVHVDEPEQVQPEQPQEPHRPRHQQRRPQQHLQIAQHALLGQEALDVVGDAPESGHPLEELRVDGDLLDQAHAHGRAVEVDHVLGALDRLVEQAEPDLHFEPRLEFEREPVFFEALFQQKYEHLLPALAALSPGISRRLDFVLDHQPHEVEPVLVRGAGSAALVGVQRDSLIDEALLLRLADLVGRAAVEQVPGFVAPLEVEVELEVDFEVVGVFDRNVSEEEHYVMDFLVFWELICFSS